MQTNRIYGLDILRAFAVLVVVYAHGYPTVHTYVKKSLYMLPSFDGVTIFFVLSGFLIGGILIKLIDQRERFGFMDLFNFWLRRWFRTLPNYFFILIILLLLYYFNQDALPPKTGRYFLFLQNFNSPHPTFYSEAWSLSVEEWFYLMIPFGLFLLLQVSRINKKYCILLGILIVLITVSVYRYIKIQHYGYTDSVSWDLNIRRCVVTRLDSIMLGFLCAFISFYYPRAWFRHRNILFFIGICMILYPKVHAYLFPGDSFFRNYWLLGMTSLAAALVLPKLSSVRTGNGYVYRIITFVSLVSYSAYLINLSLLQENLLPWLTRVVSFLSIKSAYIMLLNYIIYWSATFGLAYLIYRFFELPMLRLRDRIG